MNSPVKRRKVSSNTVTEDLKKQKRRYVKKQEATFLPSRFDSHRHMKLQRYVKGESLPPIVELEPLARNLPSIEVFEYRDWDMVRQLYLHSHPDLFHLDHFMEGEGVYIIDNVPYPIQPNTFFFIPPGILHRLSGSENKTLVTISVKFRYGLIHADFLPYAYQADKELVKRVRDLLQFMGEHLYDDARHPLPPALALTQALLMLHEANQKDISNHGEHSRVITAKRFMEEHFSEPLTLATVADAAGVGAAHLCRLFKSETGETPFEFLRKIRMARAKYWLSQSQEKIATIATACGFGSAQELNRTFQKFEGISPREFRKRVSIGPDGEARRGK